MMKKYLPWALMVMACAANADTLGLRMSGGIFSYAPSGTIRDDTSPLQTLDVKSEMGLKDDKAFSGFIYIEHPLPVIPNIRLGTTSLKLEGSGSFSKTFNNKPLSGTVTSNIDLSHTDIGLYYQLIDTGFDLDLGLNFKVFSGKAYLSDGTNSATQDLKVTVPMLYGSVNFPLFGTGLSLGADVSTISYKNNQLSDLLLRLRYESAFRVGVEGGYRSMKLHVEKDSDNLYVDLNVKGPYLNLYLHF